MKQKLLLLFGALLLTGTVWAVAPASYVSFHLNGSAYYPSFSMFSNVVPNPLDLGMVYSCSTDVNSPDVAITGYQLVIKTDREGFEYEDSHYMLVYVGVYDSNIPNSGAYYDYENDGLYLWPTTSNTPVRFGNQFWGGSTGTFEPMNEVMYAESFITTAGELLDIVLPAPLVYDGQTNTYKTGQYQSGHSYVIAIHFKEVSHWAITNENSGTWDWHYPQLSNEYSSFLWNDHLKECMLARFNYQTQEGTGAANVTLNVNGKDQFFGLLGEGQEPIELGTVYKDEATNLPALGFVRYGFESAAPFTVNIDQYEMNYSTMVYTVYKKDGEIAGQINENLNVDYRDYKTGDFGRVMVNGENTQVYCLSCFNPDNPARLSEDWAWEDAHMEANLYTPYQNQHPVLVGWGLMDDDYDYVNNSPFIDGQTYTVALYFAEYIDFFTGIHRNAGKYYKFNFTYSAETTKITNTNFTNDTNDTWYTLNGLRVTPGQLLRGIYIHNGKKVIVK